MKSHSPASSREDDLEDALRGLCEHLTTLQKRAAEYLPVGNTEAFISDILELLDGPEQRRVQRQARLLLNQTHVQIPLRRV